MNPYDNEVKRAVLLAIGVLLLGLPYLNMGLDRDEGQYLFVAKSVLEGKTLYKEVLDNKPPLFYAFLMPVVLICGESVFLLRIFALLCICLSGFVVYLLGKKLEGEGTGMLSALIFILYLLLTPSFLAYTLLSEIPSALLVSITLLVLLCCVRKTDYALFFCAALAFFMAMLIRQPAALFLPFFALAFMGKLQRVRMRLGAVFLLAACVLCVPLLLYFAATNSLTDLLASVVFMNTQETGIWGVRWSEGLLNAATFRISLFVGLLLQNPLLFAPVLLSLFYLNFKQYKPILLWGVLAFFASTLTRYNEAWPHQFIYLAAPCSLLCGAVLLKLFKKKDLPFAILTSAAIAFILILAILPSPLTESVFLPGQTVYPTYAQIVGGETRAYSGTLSRSEEEWAVSLVHSKNLSGTQVLVFMSEPQLYYLTNTGPPTKLSFIISSWFFSNQTQGEFESLYLNPIEADKPSLIFIAVNDDSQFVFTQNESQAVNARKFKAFLENNYAPLASSGNLAAYESSRR